MITKQQNLTKEQLNHVKRTIGEAFVSNELFHNWGSEEERSEDVLKYMSIYIEFAYEVGALYANENMTGFIGLEDSSNKALFPQLKMILRMLTGIRPSRIKSLMSFVKQIGKAGKKYDKIRHLEVLLVCVDKEYQGQGIATELVGFAKEKASKEGIPLLFHTDMREYAKMYKHLGCKLYNKVTADNGVTRYCLCYKNSSVLN